MIFFEGWKLSVIAHFSCAWLNPCNQTWLSVQVIRVKEKCCFNCTPGFFNDKIANFISKPPKVIESRVYVKKATLEWYWNIAISLFWRHVQLVKPACNQQKIHFNLFDCSYQFGWVLYERSLIFLNIPSRLKTQNMTQWLGQLLRKTPS